MALSSADRRSGRRRSRSAGIPVIIVNGSGRLSNGARFYTDMADGTNFGQRDIQAILGTERASIIRPRTAGTTRIHASR